MDGEAGTIGTLPLATVSPTHPQNQRAQSAKKFDQKKERMQGMWGQPEENWTYCLVSLGMAWRRSEKKERCSSSYNARENST